jgi:hypothetical protein
MRTMTRSATAVLGLLAWLLSVESGWCFYNPTTGRWLTRDPAAEADAANLYNSLHNGPVDAFDPLGMMTLNHAGEGFQFVRYPYYHFWLGIYSRFDQQERIAVNGAAAVLSKAELSWSITRCCDKVNGSGAETMYFLDLFALNEGAQIITIGTRATPLMSDGEGALWFNPINVSARKLFRIARGRGGFLSGTACGSITLSWTGFLVSQESVRNHRQAFSDPASDYTGPSVFSVEQNHKWFTPNTPEAWYWLTPTPDSATVSYGMTFQFDDCDAKGSRAFSPNPVLSAGLQRLDADGQVRGPEYPDDTEFYRVPMSYGF